MPKVVTSRTPVAFMSYVRLVDAHDHGRLTEFQKRLSVEVQVQTGKKFPIFQDRDDIKWGQNWQERIDKSLDEITFLIPIITPGFFESPVCRDELEKFLKREKKLNRNDLILPVYYVDYPLLNDAEKRKSDSLAEIIATRNHVDWRELRFEPLTSPQIGRALARIAVEIRDALERRAPAKKARAKPAVRARKKGDKRKVSGTTHLPERAATPRQKALESETGKKLEDRGPIPKTEPPTHVVDPMHREDFATISAAIEAANPGDRILVRPGLYDEGLIIDKPLEIIGDGEPGEIVIHATGQDCVLFQTNMGRMANLVLRQMGGGEWYGVEISRGRLVLEDCDITSQSLACIAIHDGADPRVRRCAIHDGKNGGIAVYKNGQGTLEDNDIFGNAVAGVGIMEGGNPALRRNRIRDSKGSGIVVYQDGQGTLEDNDIFGNALAGVSIAKGGNPVLRRNRIHDGKGSGIFVYQNGQGTVEDNDIFGNALAGVAIREGGNPVLRDNRIKKNRYQAIWIHDNGGGVFEDNDLRDNVRGAWDISDDSKKKVRRARNRE